MSARRRAVILARDGRHGAPDPAPPPPRRAPRPAKRGPGSGRGVPPEAARPMNGARPAAGTAPGWAAHVRRRAAQLGVGDGEALELLQRLPAAPAAGPGAAALGWWERRRATRALDAYAARKRAVARLARQGRL
jgi:hypothetical protein